MADLTLPAIQECLREEREVVFLGILESALLVLHHYKRVFYGKLLLSIFPEED